MAEVTAKKVLYTAKDVQKITGLSLPKVYEMFHDPQMPVVRIGGRMFMHRDKFDAWLAELATPLSEKEGSKAETDSGLSQD